MLCDIKMYFDILGMEERPTKDERGRVLVVCVRSYSWWRDRIVSYHPAWPCGHLCLVVLLSHPHINIYRSV